MGSKLDEHFQYEKAKKHNFVRKLFHADTEWLYMLGSHLLVKKISLKFIGIQEDPVQMNL